jgi:hypothetical protein
MKFEIAFGNSRDPAPKSTVEALVYSCRQGPKALKKPDNVRCIGELSEAQLHEVCDRMQQFRFDLEYEGTPAVSWSADEVRTLFVEWMKINERTI